jgi:hypothetical protein
MGRLALARKLFAFSQQYNLPVYHTYLRRSLMPRQFVPCGRIRLLGAVLLALPLALFSACGTGADTEVASPGVGGATADVEHPENLVRVVLTDFDVEMPDSITPGLKIFEIVNDGVLEHSFEIEGGNLEAGLRMNLPPGGRGTLEAELAPGAYTVYCPLASHKERGMAMELRVLEESAATN